VKLWIDECLSPTLVDRANRRGYWATCNRDRSLLGVPDQALHKTVIDEDAVFVTNDEADFVALYERVDLHTARTQSGHIGGTRTISANRRLRPRTGSFAGNPCPRVIPRARSCHARRS
jgi:hypothetical protein